MSQEAGDAGAVGTGAFNPEGVNLSQAPGPPFELPIAAAGRNRVKLRKADTLTVKGHRPMLILVGVDSGDHLNTTTAFKTDNSCHFHLLEG